MKPVLKAGLVVFVVVFCIFVVGSASYPDYTEYKNDREAAAQIKIESGLFVNRLDDTEREQNRSEYVQENEVVNTPYPETDEEYLESAELLLQTYLNRTLDWKRIINWLCRRRQSRQFPRLQRRQ